MFNFNRLSKRKYYGVRLNFYFKDIILVLKCRFCLIIIFLLHCILMLMLDHINGRLMYREVKMFSVLNKDDTD